MIQLPKSKQGVIVEFNGRRLTILEWAKELGYSRACMARRLKKMPIEKAMTPRKLDSE